MRLIKPVAGYEYGDPYGWREDIFDHNGMLIMPASLHDGVDIPAPRGTIVVAAASGQVDAVDYNSLSGNYVVVRHSDGSLTWYSHLDRSLVQTYQQVAQGDPIGTVGSSGASTGPHLHLSYFVNGYTVDPVPYISAEEDEEEEMTYINIQGKAGVRRGGSFVVIGRTAFFAGEAVKGLPIISDDATIAGLQKLISGLY